MSIIEKFIKRLGRIHPESPYRLDSFNTAVETLDWEEEARFDSLNKLFSALENLAETEIEYYFRRRGTRGVISTISRVVAWVLGTLGLCIPLLSATGDIRYANLSNYGYVYLAAGASVLAANSLFGGTAGHAQYVIAHLNLERLLVNKRVAWCKFQSGDMQTKTVEAGFEIIVDYANELHRTTISESNLWAESMIMELSKYQKTIDSQKTRKDL